jgi:hypothetical protein
MTHQVEDNFCILRLVGASSLGYPGECNDVKSRTLAKKEEIKAAEKISLKLGPQSPKVP